MLRLGEAHLGLLAEDRLFERLRSTCHLPLVQRALVARAIVLEFNHLHMRGQIWRRPEVSLCIQSIMLLS